MADAVDVTHSPVRSPVKSLDEPILSTSSIESALKHSIGSHDAKDASFSEAVILSPSTAMRDAMPEDHTPGALGQKYGVVSIVQPGHSRGSSASDMSKDFCSFPADRHEVEGEREHIAASWRSQFTAGGPHVAAAVMPHGDLYLHEEGETEIRAGYVAKPFHIDTRLLVEKSPYFAAMQNTSDNPQLAHRLTGPFFFPNLDEFAFALFVGWLHGSKLQGPSDFHTMNHYVCLYAIARIFQIETLENETIDKVREYYHGGDMTSPAFRLEFIYANTDGANPMREFLVSTAAYRALADTENGGVISKSILGVLRKEGDVGPDFAQALCRLANNDRADVRKGDPCRWHVHEITTKCARWGGFQPWEDA